MRRFPPRRARLTALAAAVVTALFVLAGCWGTSAPERTYFSLQYPVDTTWRYEQPRHPKTVRVQRFTSALAYDRQEMVYRNNPHEFQYYWYKLWAAKPRKMLQEMLAAHLRHANLFDQVVLDIGDTIPDYDLRCEILAIEELDATAEQWFAHLSMRLTLVRFDDGHTVWEHTFDERQQVYNRQPVFVVRAMSEIMESQLSVAFADMDAYLATQTGALAPAGGPSVASGSQDTDADGASKDTPRADDPIDADPTTPRARLKTKRW